VEGELLVVDAQGDGGAVADPLGAGEEDPEGVPGPGGGWSTTWPAGAQPGGLEDRADEGVAEGEPVLLAQQAAEVPEGALPGRPLGEDRGDLRPRREGVGRLGRRGGGHRLGVHKMRALRLGAPRQTQPVLEGPRGYGEEFGEPLDGQRGAGPAVGQQLDGEATEGRAVALPRPTAGDGAGVFDQEVPQRQQDGESGIRRHGCHGPSAGQVEACCRLPQPAERNIGLALAGAGAVQHLGHRARPGLVVADELTRPQQHRCPHRGLGIGRSCSYCHGVRLLVCGFERLDNVRVPRSSEARFDYPFIAGNSRCPISQTSTWPPRLVTRKRSKIRSPTGIGSPRPSAGRPASSCASTSSARPK